MTNSDIEYLLDNNIAVPLTARDMDQAHLAMTITRMDAGVEPPWMVSRRVIDGCA